jgi:hypothetical protein
MMREEEEIQQRGLKTFTDRENKVFTRDIQGK